MNIKTLINSCAIAVLMFFTFGCTKEDALYSDSMGNIINNKTKVPDLVGVKTFKCYRYDKWGYSRGEFLLDVKIEQTPISNIFLIGPIKLDKDFDVDYKSTLTVNSDNTINISETKAKSSIDSYLFDGEGEVDFFQSNKMFMRLKIKTGSNSGDIYNCYEQ